MRGCGVAGRARVRLWRWAVILAACLLGAVAGACGSGGRSAVKSGAYLVGVPIPETGPQAEAGGAVYDGEALAAAQINASGGVLGHRLVLRRRDDACNAKTAARAASDLVSEGVKAMVGNYCSDAALAAAPVVARAGLPNVQPDANSPRLTQAGLHNIFLLDPNGTGNATTAAAFFATIAHAHAVVVASDGSGYGLSIASIAVRALTARGITVPAVQRVSAHSTDLEPVTAAVRRTHADAIYWTGYYAQAALLVRQLRAAGSRAIFAAADGSVDPAFIAKAGGAADGTYATAAPTSQFLTGSKADTFDAAYRARYHRPPGPYAAYGYDALYVLARAIRNAGSVQPAKVISALHRVHFAGVTGSVSFAPDGSRRGLPFIVLTVRNGQYRLSEPQPTQ